MEQDETHTRGWRNEVGKDRHPIPFRFRELSRHPPVRPDELIMGRSRTRRGITVGLDDCVVLWKPQPSHLVGDGPRKRSLVSPIPFLDILRENVGGKIGVEGFIVIDSPRIYEKHMVSHVLAD